jgi:CRP-like cAMP-binding protein
MFLFTDRQIISATVVAESDVVELYVMELSRVYDMFKSSPGLSRRFHKSIALHLARRLGNNENF